ncbi:hypothetical protein NFI96_019937 [Prochilodus magdalenae]|nr:hypothetical protein NFI96_019937 [Prochilodus magdalenae]
MWWRPSLLEHPHTVPADGAVGVEVESPPRLKRDSSLKMTRCHSESLRDSLTYHSVQEVLVSFGRRVLCYPLYRHFSLITTAVKDTAHIFQCGEFYISLSRSLSLRLSLSISHFYTASVCLPDSLSLSMSLSLSNFPISR